MESGGEEREGGRRERRVANLIVDLLPFFPFVYTLLKGRTEARNRNSGF